MQRKSSLIVGSRRRKQPGHGNVPTNRGFETSPHLPIGKMRAHLGAQVLVEMNHPEINTDPRGCVEVIGATNQLLLQ